MMQDPSTAASPQSPCDAGKRARSVRRIVLRGLFIILLVYLGLALVFAAMQRIMIFPGAASQGRPDAVVTPPLLDGGELIELRAKSGQKVAGLFRARLAGSLRG